MLVIGYGAKICWVAMRVKAENRMVTVLMSNLIEEVFHKNKKDRKLGLMVSTHSPYIVNHLNVLLRAGYFEKARENYPFLGKDDIAVYRVNEGKIISLMATDNDTGEYVINALDMSDTMERIFEEYESMEE